MKRRRRKKKSKRKKDAKTSSHTTPAVGHEPRHNLTMLVKTTSTRNELSRWRRWRGRWRRWGGDGGKGWVGGAEAEGGT